MKVLRINQTDIVGGAAIAAYRLHEGLITQGVESNFLVHSARTTSNHVAKLSQVKWTDLQLGRLTRNLGFNDIHITSTFKITQHPLYQQADVLHLHNLHGGYFNYLSLPALTKNKPAILTLHDMWAFTGHCAYSFECNRWQQGCGRCPDLKTYPSVQRDNTRWELKLKHWIYKNSNLKAVVTTSRWMAERAQKSILGHLPVHRIPPGLNTQHFKPHDSKQCRMLLGIPTDKHVVMAAADRLTDPRKGGDLLVQALNTLPQSLRTEVVLVTLGYGAEKLSESVNTKTINLGFISGDHLKAIVYSAADIFLFPTRAENFGLVAQEAMACGTPTIAFKVGGVPDLVRHNITGYLAEPENIQDFQRGIIQLLEDHELRESLGQQSRNVALAEYRQEQYAQEYLALYRDILESSTL
ncbi:MAG: glycosyltransferase family 4 protein [Cyanobacteria bacterium P01_E01_bin.6]